MAIATGKQIERVPNAINLLFLLPSSGIGSGSDIKLVRVLVSLQVPLEHFL